MGVTNDYERDLNSQAGLKRPGRIDLRVFQNTADAGDGHPGLQRAFRNYLHEGGMEKDLQLIGYSIKGTSVDINNAEMQQLSNIGSSVITTSIWSQLSNISTSIISTSIWSQLDNIEATTISPTQWVYVGEADQPVKQADSPTFVGLTLSADVVTTSTFDGVDVGDLKTDFDTHKASSGVDHTYINQDLRTSFSPTFVGLTLSANLITTSTIDSVDIAGHDHSGANQGGTVDHVNLSNKGSNTHNQIDTHIGSTSNPHTTTLVNLDDVVISGTPADNELLAWDNSSSKWINQTKSEAGLTTELSEDSSPVLAGSLDCNNQNISNLGNTLSFNNLAYIRTAAAQNIYMQPGGSSKWYFKSDGMLFPITGNNYDIGSDSHDVRYLYYCNMSDTSCADFSHKSMEELYQMFAQIKPRTDNIKHGTKDMLYKHIDFATLPDEFATKADKDFVKENVDCKKNGKRAKTTINYKKGDNCGIEMAVLPYALMALVVKQQEFIEDLELRIKSLEGN